MNSPDCSAVSGTMTRQQAELATLRRRLASMVYEGLLLVGVWAFAVLVPNILAGMAFGSIEPGWLLILHIYLVLGCYFAWYWRRGGQTLAMQTWKLRLVDAGSGEAISLRQAWLRYTLAWPSVLLAGLGLAWAIIDPERQFLHDRLAGTRVVLLLKSR